MFDGPYMLPPRPSPLSTQLSRGRTPDEQVHRVFLHACLGFGLRHRLGFHFRFRLNRIRYQLGFGVRLYFWHEVELYFDLRFRSDRDFLIGSRGSVANHAESKREASKKAKGCGTAPSIT